MWNSQQPSGWIKTILGGVSEKKKGQDQSPETDTASCGFCAGGVAPLAIQILFFSPDNFTAVLFVCVGGGGGASALANLLSQETCISSVTHPVRHL